jgi:hypothetical protein
MSPPKGAENHGVNTLPIRGSSEHPRARFDELQRAWPKTVQTIWGGTKMT